MGWPFKAFQTKLLVSFTPVVNTEHADEIRWFEAEKDPPLADAQAHFTGTVLEELHIAVACRGETYQSGIDPRLDDAIKTRQIAPRWQGGKPRGVSQPEPAPDFLQGDIVARLRTGQIQPGRGIGIDGILFAQFRRKGYSHLHLSVRKGIHEGLKAVAIGGHA